MTRKIVDIPMKKMGDCPYFVVCLPEGKVQSCGQNKKKQFIYPTYFTVIWGMVYGIVLPTWMFGTSRCTTIKKTGNVVNYLKQW